MADFSRRLNEADAFFLPMSRAIGTTAAGVGIAIYEGTLDPAIARHHRELHSRLLPATRRRIVKDRLSTALPRWVDAPGDEPDDHWVVLPPPGDGTLRGVLDWAAPWAGAPMPADRSPWRAARFDGVLVDGVPRTVNVSQLHHSILDGGGAVRLAESLYQTGPDQPDAPLPEREAPDQITAFGRWREGWALEGAKAAEGLRANGRRVRWASREPRAAARRAKELVQAGVRLTAPVGPVPMSPLLRRLGHGLRFDRLVLDLPALKAGARAPGGRVNDAVMAATSLGLRRWHHDHGVDVPALRLAMAVNRRTEAKEGWHGNDALAVVVEMPMDEDDISRLIQRCSEVSRRAREDDDALWLMDRARAATNRLPLRVAVPLARHNLSGLDVAISNVAGTPNRQWEAGVEILDGFGCIVGNMSALAMLMSSRGGTATIGVTTCPVAIRDPERLVARLAEAFEEVYALA